MWYHTVIKRAKGAFGSPHKLGLWRHHRLEAALAADVREGRSHRPTSDGPTSPLLGTRKKDLALLNRRRPFNRQSCCPRPGASEPWTPTTARPASRLWPRFSNRCDGVCLAAWACILSHPFRVVRGWVGRKSFVLFWAVLPSGRRGQLWHIFELQLGLHPGRVVQRGAIPKLGGDWPGPSLALSPSRPLALSPSRPLALSLSRSLALSLPRSPSLSRSLALALSCCTLSRSLWLALPPSLPNTLCH